jgi:MFS family permease
MPEMSQSEAISQDSAEVGAGLLAPFHDRSFIWYFVGQLVSQVGDGIYLVALPFIVFAAGYGTAGLGVVTACYGVTRVVGFPAGGMLTDRTNARIVMLGADVVRAVLILGFALLVLSKHESLAVIAIVVSLFGLFDGAFLPASYAVLPQIVPGRLLAASNSLFATMQSAALITGPAVGGLVLVSLHDSTRSALGLLIDAATFLVSVLTLLSVRTLAPSAATEDPPREPGTAQESAAEEPAAPEPAEASDWRAVFRYVSGSVMVQMSLLVTVVVNLAYAGLTEVVLPRFAVTSLGGARGFGLMMAAFGCGTLIGGLSGMRLLKLRRRAKAALTIGVAQGLLVLCIPIGHTLAVAATAMLLAAVSQAVLNVFFLTMLQSRTPANLLGRVMSLLVTSAGIAFPISTALAGVAARAWGPVPVIEIAGVGIALAFAIGFISRTYRNL